MSVQFRKWGEGNAPCNNCTLSHQGCHGDCPKDKSEEYNFWGYAAYKKEAERQRGLRKEFLKQTDALIEIHIRGRKK